jgi:hypothetical protein
MKFDSVDRLRVLSCGSSTSHTLLKRHPLLYFFLCSQAVIGLSIDYLHAVVVGILLGAKFPTS